MKFSVDVVASGDEHWKCFIEFARGIEFSLKALGHETTPDDGRLVLFGSHRSKSGKKLSDTTILYNAEQVPVYGAELSPRWEEYLARLRQHTVWDYSLVNIQRLIAHGVHRTVHCPVGYWPGLSDIKPAAKEDVDVLFIGSMNDRRRDVLANLRVRRLKVVELFGSYGESRNNFIARAKVVLNIHFYPDPIFEIFRVSHLLANKKCVVSESGGVDSDLERFAKSTTVLVGYDQLVDTCTDLVRNFDRARAIGEQGFRVFSKVDQVKLVGAALERS